MASDDEVDAWREHYGRPSEKMWLVSPAECLTCGHKWFAVHPLGAEDLECPSCHGTDTARGESIP